jgi:hypothetical protein
MAVTDLSQDMPWWARQSPPQGYGGGPGPTGGPSAAPQGGGASSQDWLRYLMQMAGMGSAQAAEAPQTNGGPSPDDIQALRAAQANPTPPIPNNAIVPPVGPPPAPPGPVQGPGQGILPQARGVAVPPGPMAAGNSILPQGAAQASAPMGPPIPPGGLPQGPMATGGASGMGSTANPRFIGIDAPNASPQNSVRQGPEGTALNLAGLFGGKPAVSNTRVAGPMAQGGAPSGDNWNIDPKTGDVAPDLAQRTPKSKWPMPPRRPAGM